MARRLQIDGRIRAHGWRGHDGPLAVHRDQRSWGKALDEVREARLVVLGLGRSENVLIDRRTNGVTGLLDFGQAVWGDPALLEPDMCSGTKRLL